MVRVLNAPDGFGAGELDAGDLRARHQPRDVLCGRGAARAFGQIVPSFRSIVSVSTGSRAQSRATTAKLKTFCDIRISMNARVGAVPVIAKRAFGCSRGTRIMPNLQRTMALIALENCTDRNNDMDRTRG
jgi:hypothetical protein